jgi:hypothetical protein
MKYGTLRQYCIKMVFLSRRNKLMQVNQIQNAFSLDSSYLCSFNIFSLYMIAMSVLVYAHAVWFTLIAFSLEDNPEVSGVFHPFTKQQAYSMVMLPPLLILGLYPLFLALCSIVCLISNFIFGREYETVYSWHRNSIYRLIQVMVFGANLLPCMNKIRQYSEEQITISEIFTRSNMKYCLVPLVVLAICIITMVSLVITLHSITIIHFSFCSAILRSHIT